MVFSLQNPVSCHGGSPMTHKAQDSKRLVSDIMTPPCAAAFCDVPSFYLVYLLWVLYVIIYRLSELCLKVENR